MLAINVSPQMGISQSFVALENAKLHSTDAGEI